MLVQIIGDIVILRLEIFTLLINRSYFIKNDSGSHYIMGLIDCKEGLPVPGDVSFSEG